MFNILVTFRDIDYLGKLIMGIFADCLRDTCLFTSKDIGYLVPLISASKITKTTLMPFSCKFVSRPMFSLYHKGESRV